MRKRKYSLSGPSGGKDGHKDQNPVSGAGARMLTQGHARGKIYNAVKKLRHPSRSGYLHRGSYPFVETKWQPWQIWYSCRIKSFWQ